MYYSETFQKARSDFYRSIFLDASDDELPQWLTPIESINVKFSFRFKDVDVNN